MICKKDVVLWFKQLESYKRIDTMCTLLNMCLPFELRFLGTCLEELGRRDSQELRGMELRANNPTDLAADMVACQKGEPTDKKIRRKMALYLALIRACNRNCVTEIFRTLDGWGDRDFESMTDVDTLQELMLVYTMAAHHPVFSFDQHMKCNEIFEKIKENPYLVDQTPQLQAEQQLPLLEPHQDILQQQQQQQQQHAHIYPHLIAAGPIQVLPQGTIPMNFPHLTKLMPSADGSMQHQITVDGIPHMLSSNISIPTDTNAVLAHANTTWSLRPYVQPPVPPPPNQTPQPLHTSVAGSNTVSPMEQPPQAISPMLSSQQSSPASSRTTSPNRTISGQVIHQQSAPQNQQQIRNMPQRIPVSSCLKQVRRPSTETTPPPNMVHSQMDMILPPNLKHLDEMAMIGDNNSGNQLQSLIRNGYNRAAHHTRIKSGQYMSPSMHQQQQTLSPQQQQQVMNQQNFQNLNASGYQTLNFSMQNLSMDPAMAGANVATQTQHLAMDGSVLPNMNSNRSAGSDSGSSLGSSGDLSPPETPTLLTNSTQNISHKHQPTMVFSSGKQMNMSRMNGGRGDKNNINNTNSNNNNNNNSSNTSNTNSNTSGILHAVGPTEQQQQQIICVQSDCFLTPRVSNAAVSAANSSNPNSGSNNNATVLLPAHQAPPYSTNYSYHALANSSALRPPLMTQGSVAVAAPPNSFRLPGGFQLPPPPPPNGELIYPAYHPAGGIAFLTSAAPPPPPPVSLRGGNAPTTVPPQNTTTGISPFALVSDLVVNKPPSCYNCGSQAHRGRDCQSPSMDDATRGAVYKLDYSVAAQSNATVIGNVTPTTTPTGVNPPEQRVTTPQQQPTQQSQQNPVCEIHGSVTPSGNSTSSGKNI